MRPDRLARRVKIFRHRQRVKRDYAHRAICIALDRPADWAMRFDLYQNLMMLRNFYERKAGLSAEPVGIVNLTPNRVCRADID
jgi:hypothetical protein